MEGDVPVRVTVETWRARDDDPAERERLARAERMLVVADPARAGARAGQQRLGPTKVGGQRHLEIARVTGNDMDGDSTGLQQGGLIGPGLGRVRRESVIGRAQEAVPDALGRLRGDELGAVDGRDDDLAIDPLDGLGHGHDRDGRPVPGRRPDHRLHQGDRWQRPCPVVDEHDPIVETGGRARSRLERAESREARGHGVLAARPAGDDRRERPAAARSRP